MTISSDDLYLTIAGTIGNIGITVPTLNEFNKDGLNKDTFWYSDDNTRQIFADNGNAIMDATGVGVAGSAGNGFTISEYGFIMALVSALIIAAVTFVICMAGIMIGKKFGTRLSNKANILGGVILILIGLEIFITGVF